MDNKNIKTDLGNNLSRVINTVFPFLNKAQRRQFAEQINWSEESQRVIFFGNDSSNFTEKTKNILYKMIPEDYLCDLITENLIVEDQESYNGLPISLINNNYFTYLQKYLFIKKNMIVKNPGYEYKENYNIKLEWPNLTNSLLTKNLLYYVTNILNTSDYENNQKLEMDQKKSIDFVKNILNLVDLLKESPEDFCKSNNINISKEDFKTIKKENLTKNLNNDINILYISLYLNIILFVKNIKEPVNTFTQNNTNLETNSYLENIVKIIEKLQSHQDVENIKIFNNFINYFKTINDEEFKNTITSLENNSSVTAKTMLDLIINDCISSRLNLNNKLYGLGFNSYLYENYTKKVQEAFNFKNTINNNYLTLINDKKYKNYFDNEVEIILSKKDRYRDTISDYFFEYIFHNCDLHLPNLLNLIKDNQSVEIFKLLLNKQETAFLADTLKKIRKEYIKSIKKETELDLENLEFIEYEQKRCVRESRGKKNYSMSEYYTVNKKLFLDLNYDLDLLKNNINMSDLYRELNIKDKQKIIFKIQENESIINFALKDICLNDENEHNTIVEKIILDLKLKFVNNNITEKKNITNKI